MDNLTNHERESSEAYRLSKSIATARACHDQIGSSITTDNEEQQWREYREMIMLFKQASSPDTAELTAVFDALDHTPASVDPMERLLAALQPSVYDYGLVPEPVRRRDSNYSLAGEFIADTFEQVHGFILTDEVFGDKEKVVLRKQDKAVYYSVILQITDGMVTGIVEVTDNSHMKDFDSDRYLDDQAYRDIWDSLEKQKTTTLSIDEYFGDQKSTFVQEVIRQLDKTKSLAENVAANPALLTEWLANY